MIGLGRSMWRGICALGVLVFVGGLLIGAACNSGCGYVARHLNVEWSR